MTYQPGVESDFFLGLSTRAQNCLKRAEIETIDQLVGKTEKELFLIKNLGNTTLLEIKKALIREGLVLKEYKIILKPCCPYCKKRINVIFLKA